MSPYADYGLLVLRAAIGLMVAAHGAQKLFGWWGGSGMKGFAGWLTSMGLRPASFWAYAAVAGELGGGLLFALGLLDPIGSFGIMGAMLTAIALAHWNKGIWATKGGYEYPMTIFVAAVAEALIGTGKYALDPLLNINLPDATTLRIGGAVLVVLSLAAVLLMRKTQPAKKPAQTT